MTAVWASHHEEWCSAWVGSHHVFAPRVVPALGVMCERGNPSGSAVDACLDAAARARRAERVVDGGVVDVHQARQVSPHAPPITAQRVAQFYPYCTCNCLPLRKLRRDIQ